MRQPARSATGLQVRELQHTDLSDVIRIDAQYSGGHNVEDCRRVCAKFLAGDRDRSPVSLAAQTDQGLAGYLLGEVRAFEFGSEACGWVFRVAVDQESVREEVGSRLLAEACRRFRQAGVVCVRTMVRRADVPVLSFFRANGFVAGSFAQLEFELEESP